MSGLLKRAARFILRRELAELESQVRLLIQWRLHALVQEKYRREVLGETPRAENGEWVSPFERWFMATYPRRESLEQEFPWPIRPRDPP